MAVQSTQSPHLAIQLETEAFPCERLRVTKLDGRETISQLFRFDVEIACLDHHGPAAADMLGAELTLVLEVSDAEVRRIHGMISQVEDLLASHADHRAYRLALVPRAHRLSMISTQDIFMDMTVPRIIEHKLAMVGLAEDLEMRLSGEYPVREFVVQFAETDLAFVSRLAEHLGISFVFEESGGKDRIVFTDRASGFLTPEDGEEIQFRRRGEALDVFELTAVRKLIPAVYVERDFNYRTPLVDLTSQHELADAHPGGVIEHGAHFKTPAEGKALARVRAEEQDAMQLVYQGKSNLPRLAAGSTTTLAGHPDVDPVKLLIIEVVHAATFPVSRGSTEKSTYENTFRATLAQKTFRPPRVTPKPRIMGLVNGIIDPGKTGSASIAQLDAEGRYTVRFLFDTTAQGERQASRPVRMLQSHVGENYGTHFPLKPGVEVLVGFVNGDPDRPVIVGAVPNPLKPSPITDKSAATHRIRTGSGITVDITDE